MDILREAKNQMRELLGRMVLESAPELVLEAGHVPKIKNGSELRPWNTPPLRTPHLQLLAEAIMLREQWQEFIRDKNYRTANFQLLALGIGRFKVEAVGYDSTITLSIKPIRRPMDGAQVPFVPADHPPSLSAEAIPEI